MSELYNDLEEFHCANAEFYTDVRTVQVIAANGFTDRSQFVGLDSYRMKLGLESATSLSIQIGQEGIIGWVKEKLSHLGRRINIVVNKIYARITGADDRVKELIAKADAGDDSVQLPLSGGTTTAILTATAATVAAITYFTVRAFSGKKDEAADASKMNVLQRSYDKVKTMVKDGYAAAKAYPGKVSQRMDNRRGMKMVNRANASWAAKHPAPVDEHGRPKLDENGARIPASAAPVDKLQNVYKFGVQKKNFLQRFSALLGRMANAIKGFFSAFKSQENKTGNVNNKAGFMAKLGTMSSSIGNMFKIVWGWIKSCLSWVRGKAVQAKDSAVAGWQAK